MFRYTRARKSTHLGVVALFLAIVTPLFSYAESTLPTIGPVQSWEIEGPDGGFQEDLVPALREGLGEFDINGELPAVYDIFYVNPSKLTLTETSEIKVYFGLTKEGPTKALGINFDGVGVGEGNPQIVFPDTTSLIPYEDFYLGAENKEFKRTGNFPLLPGDWVDLGTHHAGESLNFFLCNADGSPVDVYTGSPKLNPGKEATMMVMSVPDAELILIGFRNPDKEATTNYFDYVFIVSVGEANAEFWLEKNAVTSPLRSILSIKDAFLMTIFWCFNMTRRYGFPVLIIAVIGILLLGWRALIIIRRQKRKRQANALYKKAQENLSAKPPIQDMRLIRKGQKLDRDTKNEKRWEVLIMKSGTVSRDFSVLLECATSSTAVFEKDESVSLFTARAAAELGRHDLFDELHNIWEKSSEEQSAWNTLESDSFNAQRRYQNARSSLELESSSDPSALARLAYLQHRENPTEGWATLKTIAEPTPETYRFQARMLEREGKIEDAEKAYRAALKGPAVTIFVVDEVAEFYRHNGNMKRALSMWNSILLPTTPEEIWEKALFFSKVTGLPLENVSPEKIPLTASHPLLVAMLTWPPDTYWDEHAMSELFQQHPILASWQSVFWLRLIEQLRNKDEGGAMAQLSLSRPGEFSWERALELVMVCALAYRRAGIIPRDIMSIAVGYSYEASKPHRTMLKMLKAKNSDAMMRSDKIFINMFNAVGWGRVVSALQHVPTPPQAKK